ncbi:MAG: DNA polymerase III subunit alpha [bacterium]
MTPFVHLHVHTEYSLLDGACRVKDLIGSVVEQEMASVAITDHGVMYGMVPFFQAARAKGVKPILGCEVYVAHNSRFERRGEGSKQPNHHLVLLATNSAGYQNLMRLVSLAHLEGFYYKPRIDKELLAQHHEGLIGLSACLKGEVSERLAEGDMAGGQRVAGQYADILGRDNFFLEVMDHGIPEQQAVNRGLVALSKALKLGLVATNDAHYLKREHAAAHEVLLCIQTATPLSDPKHMRYASNEFYLKSGDEMAARFRELPSAIANTLAIAERCNVEIKLGEPHFPVFAVPDGYNQKTYLLHLCDVGLNQRYGIADHAHPRNDHDREVIARMAHEMQVIEKTGFINYFLVVWDFVHYAKTHRIPVGPGRGSGAGSLVAYLLGITGLDPLRYGLLFERFLNPERKSPPDFDIDFCQTRRGEVIEYVKNKYGRENTAQIITFGSLGAKTVIRDVGRALEIPLGECDRWAKMVPDDPKITLRTALDNRPDFKKEYETNPNCKRILDAAFVIEGLYRNAGTHAAGVVIGERPLIEIVPLTLDKDKQVMTQYTMEPIGEIGLLKMDFLGLKTLTVIQEAVDLVKQVRGETIDIDAFPLDDHETYELLKRGDTVGVFQLESGGMRDLVRRVGVDRIEDLIAMIALYRPGPMNMLEPYVDRKTGKAPITYDHPLLEPVVAETYGVMIYQEQVQKVANVLAGYSLGQGDVLRRAMSKKKASEMEAQRKTFIKGCADKNGIPAEQASAIFDNIATFAGYGFNKSHSAAYGIVSFQTAYLKAHYPAEFMAAILSNEMGNADKLPVFANEARTMGQQVLPPHVNESNVRFLPGTGSIRFGLAGIKNVGEGAAQEIVAERQRHGPYCGLLDFCARLPGSLVNRKTIESMIRCGAFDALGGERGRLLAGVEFAMNRAASAARDRQSGQASLFDMLPDAAGSKALSDDALPPAPALKESERLAGERELLGLFMTGHPLSQSLWILERYPLSSVAGLSNVKPGAITRVGGLVAVRDIKVNKRKETMAVLQLEDLNGRVEVVVFPDCYREYAALLTQDQALLVCGEVRRDDSEPDASTTLIAQEIHLLEDAPRLFTEQINLHVLAGSYDERKLTAVRDLVQTYLGHTPLVVCLEFPNDEKVSVRVGGEFRVTPCRELLDGLRQLLGDGNVRVVALAAACLKQRRKTRSWERNGDGH